MLIVFAKKVMGGWIPIPLPETNVRPQSWLETMKAMPTGATNLGGVPFLIHGANGTGNSVYSFDEAPGGDSVKNLSVPINRPGVRAVETILMTKWGQAGLPSLASIEFIADDGSSYVKELIGDVDIRDWNNTRYTTAINGTTTVNVWTNGTGGNLVRLDKQSIELPENWSAKRLATIRFVDKGKQGTQRLIVVGLTLEVRKIPPTITLTAPLGGTAFSGPTNIMLAAMASDPDGTISRVEFFQGPSKLGESVGVPYTRVWSNAPPGRYVLTAVAVDNDGLMSTSAPVSITVTQPPCFTEVYRNEFEGSVGPEWSMRATEVSPLGARRFLGRFGQPTGPVFLRIPDLPKHSRIRVDIDLYVLGSWDGDSTNGGFGPETWEILADGRTLLKTSFRNFSFRGDTQTQAFPGTYLAARNPPRTGALENDSLGFPGGDAVYHLSFSVPHDQAALGLSFVTTGMQGLEDESWGLDNVVVAIDSGLPPVLTQEPSDQTVAVGSRLSLCAAFGGGDPASIQWRKDGVALPSETNTCLIVGSMLASSAGGYDVVAANCAGSVTSRVARVRLSVPNLPPTLSALTNRTTLEDSSPVVVEFTVGDAETAATGLEVSATSDSPALLPVSGLVLGGSGANRTLIMTPAKDGFGLASLSVVVRDGGGLAATNRFDLTVVPVNDAPTLPALADLTLDEDAPARTVNVSGIGSGAANEVQVLSVRAVSDNPGLVPDPAIAYSSPNLTGTLTLQPAPDRSGVATITVTVRDDGGTANGGVDTTIRRFTVTVRPMNDPPEVRLVEPADGSSFLQGVPIALAAVAEDRDGSVAQVEFLANGTRLGEAKTPPFRLTWTNANLGAHEIIARATDDGGLVRTSNPVRVNVLVPTNRPPVVSIVSPEDQAGFDVGVPVEVAVEAGDLDGRVTRVELLVGSRVVQTNSAAPWTFRVDSLDLGLYRLTARAVDDRGASAVSAPVDVEVSDRSATVAIVRNFPGREVDLMREYLFQSGLRSRVFDQEGLSVDQLKGYQLVVWDDLGEVEGGLREADVAIFEGLRARQVPLYFIGRRLTGSEVNLGTAARAAWRGLTGLRATGLTPQAGSIAAIAENTHPVTTMTGAGPMEPFGSGNPVERAAVVDAEHWVLARSGDSDVLLLWPGPDVPVATDYRSVTQNFLVDDPVSGETRKQIFLNAVCWLTRACECPGTGLYNMVVQASAEPAGVVTADSELSYVVSVKDQLECRMTGVVLRSRFGPGIELVRVEMEKGYWEEREGGVDLVLGYMAQHREVLGRIVVRPTQAGWITNRVAGTANQKDLSPENNEVAVVTQVLPNPNARPVLEARWVSGEVELSWEDASGSYRLESAARMPPGAAVEWLPVSAAVRVEGGRRRVSLDAGTGVMLFRVKR